MTVEQRSTYSMDAADLDALRDVVRGVCARLWPAANCASDGDLDQMWAAAAEHGWTDLAAPELFGAVVAAQQELGRVACPIPLIDIALVGGVLAAVGETGLARDVAVGAVRPLLVVAAAQSGDRVFRHVEAAKSATHLLVLEPDSGSVQWHSIDHQGITELPGLAIPAWSQVRTTSESQWTAAFDKADDVLLVRRVGLAARAMAANRRTHELAVDHARQRKQFGAVIGSFQAVSHRLVNAATALAAAEQLLDHATILRSQDNPDWRMAAEVFVEFISTRLATLQFDGHHTLAAIGYFEEHEAPWLFRRLHADLAALAAAGPAAGLGNLLVDSGMRLPDFALGPDAEALRAEVLEAFGPWIDGPPSHLGSWADDAREVLRERGWIGVGWPTECGGRGFNAEQLLAFTEAIAYADPPVGNIWMGINSIVPMLVRVGPPELRDLVIEECLRGDLSIALGYSESEAGSDLAALRTRAERTDGGWLINGQKLWGTCVPDSKWIVVAARTDPDASPPHAGISLFLVDTDSAGVTVQSHRSLGGEVSATTFWDDVFVPDERLIGQPNRGWQALGVALTAERVLIGASVMRVRRAFDRLVELVTQRPEVVVPSRRADLRAEIGRLAARLQATGSLVNASVRAMSSDRPSGAEASMAKIMATELGEDLNAAAIALLGPDALYLHGVDGGVAGGHFDNGLRMSIMGVIAGGTGDIQRNLVARTLGLR